MATKSVEGVKNDIYAEIAKKSGVTAGEVKKVMLALGVNKHFAEANKLSSGGLKAKNILIGFRVSSSSVTV